ncbi:hypothetical protein GFY24_10710 [Nocardia sp. SYP-A9097]|uniref:hypothetical protein n=1 Tax=Nocardia sp. SYP-A9097 TaxID=2663237 RepID=UPI00129AA905|nr:hypothetical protein [Nocardia sp. SYP-A9097]MRH87910.1 hypothetical protein [Nocardia sp. SYP-A9097]
MTERDHRADSRPAPNRLEMLEDQLRQVSGYCDRLHRQALPSMSRDIAQLFAEFAELNGRFTAILANRHESGQSDTTTTDHLGHYEISHQLRSFVEQDLRRAVQRILPPGTSSTDRAHLISRCAAALFKNREIDRAAVEEIFRAEAVDTAQLEYDILQRAAEIRQAATDLGHDHRWDFTCEPGTSLDPETQEPWGVCDPDEPTAFVVVPSYYVSRRLLLKQQVVTSALPATPSGAADPA